MMVKKLIITNNGHIMFIHMAKCVIFMMVKKLIITNNGQTYG